MKKPEVKKLRADQEEVLDNLLEFCEEKNPPATGFIVMPGASGKTLIFSEFIKRMQKRAIIAAHTKVILDQNYKTLEAQDSNLKLSKYYGGLRDLSGDVIFMSYNGMLNLFKKGILSNLMVEIVVCDEVHKALTLKRIKTINSFNAFRIGFTATDKYSELKNVEIVFKNEIHRMLLPEAVEEGNVLPLRGFIVDTEVDVRDVVLSQGVSLNTQVAEKELNILARNLAAKDTYLKYFKGMPTLVSCISIKHAQDVNNLFRESGLKSALVHGKVSSEQRKNTLHSFENGEIDVLCTVDVLLEGWNSKRVSVLFNLRPTYSWVLAEQRIYRILRIEPGKECGIVVDFSDIYRRHDQPILAPNLFGFRKYQQGSYLLAPKEVMRKEKERIKRKEAVCAFGEFIVESKFRKIIEAKQIVRRGSIIKGRSFFTNNEIVKEILLSAKNVQDYRKISFKVFCDMRFDFQGLKFMGITLIRRYFGLSGNIMEKDYFHLLVDEVLGDYYFYRDHELVPRGKIENMAQAQRADPFYSLVMDDLSHDLIRKIISLSTNQIKAIILMNGIGCKRHTLHEAGDVLGFGQERVRQIYKKAIWRMNHPSRSEILEIYLSDLDNLPIRKNVSIALEEVLRIRDVIYKKSPPSFLIISEFYDYLHEVIEEEGGVNFLKELSSSMFSETVIGKKSTKWKAVFGHTILRGVGKAENETLSGAEAFKKMCRRLYPEVSFN